MASTDREQANSVLQALYYHKPFRDAIRATLDVEEPILAPVLPPSVSSPPSPNGSPSKSSARPSFSRSGTSAGRATIANAFHRRSPSSSDTTSPAVPVAGPSTAVPPPPPTLEDAGAMSALTANGTTTLLSTLHELFAAVGAQPKKQGVVAPSAFIGQLRRENELFRSTMHQDAHEFLGYLLNAIAEDVERRARLDGASGAAARPVPLTWVHRLFEGVLTNETRCLTCETVTSRDESFLDLSIDIEENTSITACLRQFSASEMLAHTNKFSCDACWGLQEAEKRCVTARADLLTALRMKIKKLPNVLALHLKRFKYQEEAQRFIKLTYRVVFPLELRLFNTLESSPDPDRLYSLWAIVVHIGVGPDSGHYVTIIKNAERWLLFDDENVSEVDEADLPKYFGDTPGVGSGYVLFYESVPDSDVPPAPLVHMAHHPRASSAAARAFSAAPASSPPATPSTNGSLDLPSPSPIDAVVMESTSGMATPIAVPHGAGANAGPSGSGLNRLFGSLSKRAAQANGLAPAREPPPPLPAVPSSPIPSSSPEMEVLAPSAHVMATDASDAASSRGSSYVPEASPALSRASFQASDDPHAATALHPPDQSDAVSTHSSVAAGPAPVPASAPTSKDGSTSRLTRLLTRPKSKRPVSSIGVPTVVSTASSPQPTAALRHTSSAVEGGMAFGMGPTESASEAPKRKGMFASRTKDKR